MVLVRMPKGDFSGPGPDNSTIIGTNICANSTEPIVGLSDSLMKGHTIMGAFVHTGNMTNSFTQVGHNMFTVSGLLTCTVWAFPKLSKKY